MLFYKGRWHQKKIYIKPMNRQQKLSLFNDIRAEKNVNKVNDKKLINSAIWGERKFMRAIVRLGMLLCGILDIDILYLLI